MSITRARRCLLVSPLRGSGHEKPHMDRLIALQRWLYGGMAESMRSTADVSGLPLLVGLSFVFGMVHAFMPGHGKSVLVSHHLGRAGRPLDGLVTGSLLALTHVGAAIVFVTLSIAVVSRAAAFGGRAPAFEKASAAFIALIGLYLVVRTFRPTPHRHAANGPMLAVATGLVPCPLTTFILTYAVARGKLALGLAVVTAMLGGVIVTLVTFAVAAIAARRGVLKLLARSATLRKRIGWSLELAGALGVLTLGGLMLAGNL